MNTPHNNANKGEIAKTVLMPGDPLRAKFIAETYLENATLVSDVRNIYAYTGTYKGKKVTVMASGMGMPSIGIYSYELYTYYDVDNIIRIGTAGAYTEDLKLYDVVLADSAYSESTFAKVQNGEDRDTLFPSETLNQKIMDAAKRIGIPCKLGKIHSSDVFYREKSQGDYTELVKEHGVKAVEMESFALFHNANVLGKHAACLLTIANSFVTGEETSTKERQEAFNRMMEVALEAAE
ncbi:MAG: purine-nucleoside phosphorylase [Lachnospiraceae bacterium]|nr:purine-nucleoside phosphorylase [Lachnospiraceae bacterium]